ncbi:branched-chain amino acid ABC transporter permease [Paraburkholderia sp. LEh10]|uniref:ABC transporter permease n=1 Tax=Paraburkholderia sp. LEh10 TaxID=2821353 RepID=UPI001AE7727F|nr:branched-chain amino acid ABC transporter permease [Paraburkholderia sp. LEh10]MBP0590441.1 branched-chain amino acid ABC transporter permease [Paraburkholderia sp. LEh10]
MFEHFGVLLQALSGQILVGMINGSFYAMLSLGLAIIFGLLNIVNFAHGAMYMMGSFVAWYLLNVFGVGYWYALILAPITVGAVGIVIERLMIRRVYRLDHIYGLLLTLGLSLIIEGLFRQEYGNAGQPYSIPPALLGAKKLGFMVLPYYRVWVIVASLALCLSTWFVIEKTRLGAYLRAATENPMLVRAFGINVPRLIMLTYGFGVALAALGGVMAAPVYQVSPLMGSNIVIVVFAVVVIGGMGSIIGAVISGFCLGIVEGLTKFFYPEGSTVVIFVVMAIVLLLKPAGLFGKTDLAQVIPSEASALVLRANSRLVSRWLGRGLLILAIVAPFIGIYPGFAMKAMCFALFAAAFNLLIGFAGLMSFGHAAFFGVGAYASGIALREWGVSPEIALVISVAGSALIGLIFGLVAIRRQGIYFAMVTLALSQLIYFLCVQMPFTGGEDGLRDVPRGKLFGLIDLTPTLHAYYFVLFVSLVGLFIIYRCVHSPFGRVLKAIGENEPRAISLGYKTRRIKLIAFVLSAALAGLAGGAKTLVFQIAALTDVHWAMSGEVVLMTLIGGLGTLLGPMVGAIVMISIEGYLASLGSWVTVIQGIIFVACVLLFRQGMVGGLEALVARRGRQSRRGTSDGGPECDEALASEGTRPIGSKARVA